MYGMGAKAAREAVEQGKECVKITLNANPVTSAAKLQAMLKKELVKQVRPRINLKLKHKSVRVVINVLSYDTVFNAGEFFPKAEALRKEVTEELGVDFANLDLFHGFKYGDPVIEITILWLEYLWERGDGLLF